MTIEELKQYKYGIGMLLSLVKLSRPDICNTVRELSKVMVLATQGHYKSLLWVINYVFDTRNMGLRFNPDGHE